MLRGGVILRVLGVTYFMIHHVNITPSSRNALSSRLLMETVSKIKNLVFSSFALHFKETV